MTTQTSPATRGQTVDVFGNLITFLMPGAETGMRFSMVDVYSAPGAGSPPHFHHDDEEAFFVLDGEYEFVVGGEVVTRGPGTVTKIEKGVPHAFTNRGDKPARMIIVNWPADMHERFFLAVGTPREPGSRDFAPPSEPDFPAIMAAARASGIELLPPAAA